MRRHAPALHACGALILSMALLGPATGVCAEPADLLSMSLESLMQVTVTSAVGQPHALSDTAAAVDVITAEDIRRSGARTLPELLRQVPGLDVARINDTTWAVSARGFNARYANMLLVLVDGRSVYTPMFGGVYWDAQNVPLDEVERVEVIRGPGGTLWGANAVNGIINVITKDAAATGGATMTLGSGTDERAFVAARQGAALPDGSHLRVYAQSFDREPTDWSETRGGFRWDGTGGAGRLTLEGEGYGAGADRKIYVSSLTPPQTVIVPDTADLQGAHLLLHWTRGDAADGWRVRAYTDQADRQDGLHAERVRTTDLEVRRQRRLGRHALTGGVGGRVVVDHIAGSLTESITPDHSTTRWASAFVQDEVTLAESLRLTLGTKLEHNDFTGYEHQPSARLLWHPAPDHALWGAVSRAVRVSSRGYANGRLVQLVTPGSPPTAVAILGNPDAASAELLAYEAGYRGRPEDRLTVDLAAFVNRYRHVSTLEPGAPFLETSPAPDHLLVPLRIDSRAHATTWGAEASATWQAAPHTRLTASYGWLRAIVRADAGSGDMNTLAQAQGSSPQQQLRLAVRTDPTPTVELDGALKLVDELPALGVPGYADLDLRLAWHPVAAWSLGVDGQHLLQARHREFAVPGATDVVAAEVPRTVFARVTWAQ